MKIKLYILLFFPIYLTSQTSYEREWATYFKSHDDTYFQGFITSATLVENNNLLFTTFGKVEAKFSIIKFSSSGDYLWEFSMYDNPTQNPSESTFIFDDVKMDLDGNYVFSGHTDQTHSIASSNAWQTEIGGGLDRFLGKLSPSGEIIWCTYFGGAQDDRADNPENYSSNVEFTSDNEILWQTEMLSEGMGTSGTFQPLKQDARRIISKFDTDGQRIWSTYYGTGENCTNLSQLKLVDTGIWIVGNACNSTYYDMGSNTWAEGSFSSIYMSKLDFNGNRVSSNYLAIPNNFFMWKSSLDVLNKDLYLTGYTDNNYLGTPNAHNVESFDANTSFLLSLNSYGAVNWATYLSESGPTQNAGGGMEFSTVAIRSDKIFIASHTKKTDSVSTPDAYQTQNMGNTDAYVMIFSPAGELQWGSFYGGDGDETSLYPFAVPFDGGFYLLGSTNSPTNISTPGAYQEEFSGNMRDVFIVKFVEENLGVADQDTADASFLIYPNPAKDVVQVKTIDMQSDKVQIRLFSINGKLIKSKIISSSSTEIDVRGLASGSYVIVVENGNKISSQKLLIQ